MFVDASAIVAILASEEDADALALRLGQADRRITSPLAVYEATVGLARQKGRPIRWALGVVDAFLQATETEVQPIGRSEMEMALDAFDRFGKGRHPARLNLGDCFAYACARSHGAPLLFKGDDFSSTDIEQA
jgi:ribonuclease VapC